MKSKEKKAKTEAVLDPILFAATVPSREPTAKDRTDCQEQPDDAIEPKKYEKMDDMVKDL